MPIERVREGLDEARDAMREANDIGEKIAESRERQSQALENVRLTEEGDRQALSEAISAAHAESVSDFNDRVNKEVESESRTSEGLQSEAAGEAQETGDGVRGLEQARGVAEYGASSIEKATEGARDTVETLRELQERGRAEVEEALGTARANEARL